MSTRISLPDEGALTPEQSEIVADVLGGRRGELVGPLRAALHSPELARRWSRLGEFLRFDTVLDPALSEMVILMVARRWNCELEWAIHKKAALQAGLDEQGIDAICDGRIPALREKSFEAVYAYTARILNTGTVCEMRHAAVVRHLGERGVVELTALMGYYIMVAITLNAHAIPLPRSLQPELTLEGRGPSDPGFAHLPEAATLAGVPSDPA